MEEKKKRMKRRDGMLYRARKKGVRIDTRERMVYFILDSGTDPMEVGQVKVLVSEFGFGVQLAFL